MRLELGEVTDFRSHPCAQYYNLGTHFGLHFWRASNCGGGDHVVVEMLRTAGGLPAGRVYECMNLHNIARKEGEFSTAAVCKAARLIWEGKVRIHHAWVAPIQLGRIAREFNPERLPV